MRFMATLPCSDVERAKAWYAAILELQPARVSDDGNAWFESDGTEFLLYASQFAGSNQATAMGLGVDDVEASVAAIKGRGGEFEDYDFGDEFRTVDGILTLPDGNKLAWIKDSEGNTIGLAPKDM